MSNIQTFVEEFFQNDKVLILQSADGFAISFSEDFEYEDESQLEVICFWSSAERAKEARKGQWENHQLVELAFGEFVEQWLIGMYEEVSLAGINFNAKGEGEEVLPLDLMLEIANYGIRNQSAKKLNHFKSFDELRQQIIELKESEN